MNKYNIGFHYEQGGHLIVEAKTEQEAKDQVLEHLEMDGLDRLSYKSAHRDYFITDSERVLA